MNGEFPLLREPEQLLNTDHGHYAACIVCGSLEVNNILEIERVPVQCNVLFPTRAEALDAPTGSFRLVFCNTCGHLANSAFDLRLLEYSGTYENSLHYSPRFQTYLSALIERLNATYALEGKHVIDVGCGKGEFLISLCDQTGCTGTGFDRSYEPESPGASFERRGATSFVVDFYGRQFRDVPVDLLTCRHVLEHIEHPLEFLGVIRDVLGECRSPVFFEVPDARYTVQNLGIWDLIYEHVSYFTPASLCALFSRAGFNVSAVVSEFEGQYLTINAYPAETSVTSNDWKPGSDLSELVEDVRRFRTRYHSKVDECRARLEANQRNGDRVVIWGGGSKGVTFLNVLGQEAGIEYVVDVNPRKLGKFVPGTGQEVVPPEFLREFRPDCVVIMNPNYEFEIRESLQAFDLDVEVLIP